MSVAAVAFCPHPPLLVPGVAGGAAPELEPLRAACAGVLRAALAAAPGGRVLVVGSGPADATFRAGATGSFAAYGVPLDVALGGDPAPGPPVLPLSLTVGAWLLGRLGRLAVGELTARSLPADLAPGAAATLGAAAAGSADVLVVMGDGSACRSEQAPGWYDERAAGVDGRIAAALAAGEPDGLALDPELAAELRVAGRVAWDFARGAAAGAAWRAGPAFDAAPYGVGYFAAVWTRA